MIIKNPQASLLLEWMHKVIYNMLLTKYLYNKVFDRIYTWDETLTYIAWVIRAYHHLTIWVITAQAIFGRCMKFNVKSILD